MHRHLLSLGHVLAHLVAYHIDRIMNHPQSSITSQLSWVQQLVSLQWRHIDRVSRTVIAHFAPASVICAFDFRTPAWPELFSTIDLPLFGCVIYNPALQTGLLYFFSLRRLPISCWISLFRRSNLNYLKCTSLYCVSIMLYFQDSTINKYIIWTVRTWNVIFFKALYFITNSICINFNVLVGIIFLRTNVNVQFALLIWWNGKTAMSQESEGTDYC